ncbi:MAG: transposase [Ruminococcus sp.]|uniref:transposase n=1 Tax=Ruminococcus sp. TaxID=41978 RepID=UPI0025EEC435|nr:transposase [Ruminococcus sp.]MCR5600585.1 transposase [Ruminococcus sp.]
MKKKKEVNKVVRLALYIDQYDKDGKQVDYKEINQLLWELQKQTREIKNKTIQYCWEYYNFRSDYYKKFNSYPKEKDILNYSLAGFIMDKLKTGNDLYSQNCTTTVRGACKEFEDSREKFLKGESSIITYKPNQPIDIHNERIDLKKIDKDFYLSLNMVNTKSDYYKKYKDTKVRFKVNVKDDSTQTILERCIDQIYKIGESKLIYNRKKKLWFLNMVYKFEPQVIDNLDPDKILGVDLGVALPICASVYGDLNRFTINGGEIEEFRRRVEARKKSLLKQGRYCGDGRIGHGIKTRNKSVYAIEDKIARFRDTANHKYSRALIDYAVKNGCGTIQMEELSGITSDANRFLKNWTYYDLQTKIKNKAEEKGINVVFIKPRYTSKRCSKCGYINADNRKYQAHFLCLKCGFKENADYNASQNLSIRDIDKIIENEINQSAKSKQTE